MKSAKKKLTMAVGMVLGVTVLAGAAFASYNTSNGYMVGKTAIKGLMKNENYTSEINMSLSVDGEELMSTKMNEFYDRNGDVKLNCTNAYTYGSPDYSYEAYTKKTYFQDNKYINTHIARDESESSTYIYENPYPGMGRGGCDLMYDETEDEAKTTDKIIYFVELIGDTMVGDLKNNIVYVSGDDNSSTYEINLDAIQIPEVINAGLSAMFSVMSTDNYDEPFMALGTDPIVKNAALKFTVDKEGRLLNADTSVTMTGSENDGTSHEATLKGDLTMSDYGTTKPERVDISTLPNVETIDDGYYASYSEENVEIIGGDSENVSVTVAE